MDFFERQAAARRKTKWLVFYFFVCVGLTILAVYLAFAVIFLKLQEHRGRTHALFEPPPSPLETFWDPQLFLGVSIGTIAVVALASIYKMSQLSGGGSVVATSLGGRPLSPHPTDFNEQKLRNVVEEMAIASGVPVPEIYVLDGEPGINAFAAGHSTSDAVIGVTRGAIELLDRDELQGVIAHEFSHILNGDMRLNLRLMAWVFGILCVAFAGRILLRVRGSDRKASPLQLLGLFLLIIGGIGVFFGRLIKAAISRQREFLADASAVQFTRNPGGLAGALKKIGGLAYGSRLESAAAEDASHMFFGNGLGESWFSFFATHPPLEERIRLLDSNFDGTFTRVAVTSEPVKYQSWERPAESSPVAQHISAAAALAQVGTPSAAHIQYSAGLVQSIPSSLKSGIKEPFSATAVVYSLLLSSEENVRTQQLGVLKNNPALAQETFKRIKEVQNLDQQLKLPIVELALPALRQLSQTQYEDFKNDVKALVEADQQIDLFEYALQKMLLRHLESRFGPARKPIVQYYVLRGLTPECCLLLSALAHVGHDELDRIQSAFCSGISQLELQESSVRLYDLNECTLDALDRALDRLNQTAPQCKKTLLAACLQVTSADGLIQAGEAELLRAIADSLDCPMPPLIQA